MMDYHFGRLSPELNAAVERHVQSCAICQREGLVHLATEKRDAVRLSRRSVQIHSQKRRLVRLFELLFSVGLLLLLVPVIALPAYRQRLPWFNSHSSPHAHAPTATIAPTPTPTLLRSGVTFAAESSGSVAAALSPNGKLAALATVQNGAPVVAIWNAGTGKQAQVMPYPFSVAPGVLAWSPDGTHLAAANGAIVTVWDVASATQLWSIILPQSPALRVYDVQAAGVAERANPAAIFGMSPFAQWSANGQIAPAPANAADPAGFALPNGPIVGLWQVAGSHLFAAGSGQVDVGISSADTSARVALLTWSPDNHYLLWASVARPVAAGQSGTPVSGAVQPPDAAAQALAAHVAASSHGDALVWFAPNGAWVAFCDRTIHAAPLVLAVPDQTRPLEQIPGACDGLTSSALTWRADSSGFVLAPTARAVASYALPAPANS
jgi:hypothetical protein